MKKARTVPSVLSNGRTLRLRTRLRGGASSRAAVNMHAAYPVGVKIPVENREGGARMIAEHSRIERESYKYDQEQSEASQAQSRMRHAMKKPAKRCAFQGPPHRDPLPVKLDRENQRDEKQRGASKQRQLGIPRSARERCALED